jgi:hypothetical protein
MKKLDIKLGGHPLTGDDLLFLQSSITEGLTALAQGLAGPFFVISGVNISISGGTITWTAGWIYMAGEICQVDSGSATFASNDTFVIVETADTAGDVTYEDLNTESTYLIRKATIQGNAGGTYLYTNLNRLRNFNDRSVFSYGGSWTSAGSVAFAYLDITGKTCLRGNVVISSYSPTPDANITTLAAKYRPDDTRRVIVPAVVGGTNTFLHVTIASTGEVVPLGLTAGNNATLYLDGVSFNRTFVGE